ncbi:hypothetical protein BaRGS_00020899 [Batillaria attramentaria]|uniref:Neurotransmitter-gated ion-channel ligand-binding domain-containing protein n=1 Tax=Batillaria attramentaria TaxID=370345 RepID=A0ABD0KLB0_9CAEN
MLLAGILRISIVILAIGVPGSLPWATRRLTEEELSRMIGVGRREVKGLPLVGPVTVTVTYDLVAVMDLNAEQGYMETTGWLYMSWTDPRLAYTSTRGAGDLTNIAVDKDSIWTPDIELYNMYVQRAITDGEASSGLKMLGQKTQAVVSQDGTVFLIEKTNVRSVCDVSGQLAHGDSVMCPLKFGSWASHAGLIDVHLMSTDATNRDGPRELRLSEFRPAGRWTATGASQQRDVLRYDCCPEQYALTTFNFTFQKRRLG